jgi:nucleoside-diphosphate-sugar epimerase
MGADFSDSVQIVQRLLTGKVPGLPRLGFNVVDVRDVADLHLRAMTAPEAAGQRFIAASGFKWMSEMAELLRRELGPAAAKVPTRAMPDFVIRLASIVDRDLRNVTRDLGQRRDFTAAKARELLDWRPRTAEETILDCARSLIEHGAI